MLLNCCAGCAVLVCPFTAQSHAKPWPKGWGFCSWILWRFAVSAIGTKRTWASALHMSAFGSKADMIKFLR